VRENTYRNSAVRVCHRVSKWCVQRWEQNLNKKKEREDEKFVPFPLLASIEHSSLQKIWSNKLCSSLLSFVRDFLTTFSFVFVWPPQALKYR
jgi:hypothetical protein